MRRSRLFVVAMLAAVSVLAMSVSGVLARDRGQSHDQALPPGSVVVTGDVQQRLRLSVADLAAMPNQQTVEVTYRAGAGSEHHVFTGPLLRDVLARAVPQFDPAIKNDGLRHYVSVTASDAYQALVVPGDIAGGRYVTGVVKVALDKPRH